MASELVLDVLGKRGQTRTRPRRRSEAVSSAGGDRGDGASPLQRHRIEEVALVAASMRYEGGRNAGGAFEGGGEGGSSDGDRVMWQGCEDAAGRLELATRGGGVPAGVSGGGGEQVREVKANLEISILHYLWISGTN